MRERSGGVDRPSGSTDREITALQACQSLMPLTLVALCRYAGWWLCCIPVPVLHELGLPLPFFIKGDDVEQHIQIRDLRKKGILEVRAGSTGQELVAWQEGRAPVRHPGPSGLPGRDRSLWQETAIIWAPRRKRSGQRTRYPLAHDRGIQPDSLFTKSAAICLAARMTWCISM